MTLHVLDLVSAYYRLNMFTNRCILRVFSSTAQLLVRSSQWKKVLHLTSDGDPIINKLIQKMPGIYIIILILHLSVRLSVRACVRESGRSREAIRPVLKKLPILLIARVGRYTKSPLTQPAMTPALD